MRSLATRLLILLLLCWPLTIWAAGNESASTQPVTPGGAPTAGFLTDLRNILGGTVAAGGSAVSGCQGEDACRFAEHFPGGMVFSGGTHATAGSCTSAAFATTAYTPAGNRVRNAAAAIDYSTVGCNCADPGSDTAWVIASALSADTSGNFQRVSGTDYFVDCVSTNQPTLPSDSTWLMKTNLVNGAINTVTDLRALYPTALVGDNTHQVAGTDVEFARWLSDLTNPFIISGCLPVVPASGLTLTAFACQGYVRESNRLYYITQEANAVTIPNAATVWLALHRDRSTTLAGWTRVDGTHYLVQAAASQPAEPTGGVIFAEITVSGGNITVVGSRRRLSPLPGPVHDITSAIYGAIGDGTGAFGVGTDNTTAIQRAIDDAIETRGIVYIPVPVLPGGCYRVTGALTIVDAVGMQIIGGNRNTARLCSEVAAGSYALTIRNSLHVWIHHLFLLMTASPSGNGLRFDRTSGTTLYNSYSGLVECTARAGVKPALGAGSVGIEFTGTTSNFFNTLDYPYVNRCDNAIVIRDANNAQRILTPQLENYWYGIVLLGDETHVSGGFCHQAAGAGGSNTECLVVGTAGDTANFSSVVGLVAEPGTATICLTMDSSSSNNLINIQDNCDQSNTFPTSSNTIILRQTLQGHTIVGNTIASNTTIQADRWITTDPQSLAVADGATGTMTVVGGGTHIIAMLVRVQGTTGGTLAAYHITGAYATAGGNFGACWIQEILGSAGQTGGSFTVAANNFTCSSPAASQLRVTYANDEAANTENHILTFYPTAATEIQTLGTP